MSMGNKPAYATLRDSTRFYTTFQLVFGELRPDKAHPDTRQQICFVSSPFFRPDGG